MFQRNLLCASAVLLLCCNLALGAGRTLSQAPGSARPAPAPVDLGPKCTPKNPLNIGGLGGLYSHGTHQSLSCPLGQIVTSITLGTSDSVQKVLSSIQIDCANSAFGGQNYPTTKILSVPSANQTTNFTSLTSADGFNTASVYTSNETLSNTSLNLKTTINPIVEATFGTPDGQQVSGGTPGATITGDATKQAAFDIPNNARISAFGLFFGTYINGLTVSLICPDLAGSVPTTAPTTAVQG